MTYAQHNDEKGKAQRMALAVNRADRARMAALESDSGFGLITLVMDRRELQRRLQTAVLTHRFPPAYAMFKPRDAF